MPVKLSVYGAKQAGSSLMLAVFIILVMSLLATALIRMIDSSQESVAVEVFGTRALLAANTGVEAMAARVFPTSATATSPDELTEVSCADLGLASDTLTGDLPNTGGMNFCRFRVTCDDIEVSVAASSVRFYRFTSFGSCDVGDWQTSRTVQVEAKVL